ncbi:leucine zipper-EF-hand containing transmembrane protein [Babesia gibsoni]|uniref:Leucine zipper-EF-hand containing transmembrane protein n=1 Tax=Babesia gibsoni TaxID=33632 RepID=A0AAD8LSC1_BABGI|nr:leucine zipper-EF-hand containing transmembrane protein [Babesia gibsoni]
MRNGGILFDLPAAKLHGRSSLARFLRRPSQARPTKKSDPRTIGDISSQVDSSTCIDRNEVEPRAAKGHNKPWATLLGIHYMPKNGYCYPLSLLCNSRGMSNGYYSSQNSIAYRGMKPMVMQYFSRTGSGSRDFTFSERRNKATNNSSPPSDGSILPSHTQYEGFTKYSDGAYSNVVYGTHGRYGVCPLPYSFNDGIIFVNSTSRVHFNTQSSRLFSSSGESGRDQSGTGRPEYSRSTITPKHREGSRGLLRLSIDCIRWAIVLPFRIGMWTLHLLSLSIRMVGNLMRLFAHAAVVARASGVSGIFKSIIDGVRHTIHWCKTGFRLYFANVKVSYYILLKRLKGHPMRYNERKLLMKTLNDALKMVPFSFFIIVPFAEFLLPVAIRLFPQMLPSTFRTDNPNSDDYLQKKLLAKKELAQFFQELVQERTNQILQEELDSSLKTKMEALKDFQERILNKGDQDVNPFLSSNELLVFSKLFKNEFKLDKMNLETLKVMCKLLGITPFSMPSHVVLQLRHHLLKIQREDRLILWEGVDSLSTEELQEACRDRAMKFYNVDREQLQQQLKQWLDLSSMPEISPILLLWSRCITMTHEPMAIKDEEAKEVSDEKERESLDEKASTIDQTVEETVKHSKVAEKFAEEVNTAQKASSRPIVKAVAAAAELDAQKLFIREERLEELSQKAKELKDIIEGTVDQPEDEELVDSAMPFDETKPEELVQIHHSEDRFMSQAHGDHVILHTNEIDKLNRLTKQEILVRHEELLSALNLQRQISDLQHNQLTDMFMFLLKVSEEANAGKELNLKENLDHLVKDAREQMQKVEELTCRFDKHNLTYD